MYMCYLDESGVPENTGTSHFVLLGLAIVAEQWSSLEQQITIQKRRFGLQDAEIHTAWMARRYVEQEQIVGFEGLSWDDRRRAVEPKRRENLLRLSAHGSAKQLKSAKKNYTKTADYVHLTRSERMSLLQMLADLIGRWQGCRLFAQVVDKSYVYSQSMLPSPPFEYCFTELVQRYEYFLRNRESFLQTRDGLPRCALRGLIVQDNNQTVAKRLTAMMRRFHREGTRWTGIDHIIETPLFVDSQLTSMVQMADLCAYATRRFFENSENDLFDRIYDRFDRAGSTMVGIRHYTRSGCSCRVCANRGAT